MSWLSTVASALVLAAAVGCSTGSATDEATLQAGVSTSLSETEATSSEEAQGTEATTPADKQVTQEDLARFVAATEAAIEDTELAGTVLDDPETYIALAQASCVRFSNGESLSQVASDHLEESESPTEDDERLVGAVLGAAVETICPENGERL